MRVKQVGDAPLFIFEFAQNRTATEWIQVALEGLWPHLKYGMYDMSKSLMASIVDNFNRGVFPRHREAAIDYEHLGTQPNRKPGDGVAAGWIKELALREHGTQVWGRVEWTDPAKTKIEAGEYRYFSPTIIEAFPVGDGKTTPVLFGGAITNYPTMALQPIALANHPGVFLTTEQPEPPKRNANMKLIKVKNAAGQDIEIDLESLPTDIATLSAIPSVRELQARVPAGDARVVPSTEFAAMQTSLSALEGKVTAQQTTLAEQTTKITELSAENKRYKDQARDARIAKLLSEGRILPSEKDTFVELSNTVPDMFEKMMTARASAPPLINLGQSFGSGNAPVSGGQPPALDPNGPIAQFDAKVREIQTGEKVTYGEAVSRAAARFSELAQAAKDAETVTFTNQPG